MAHISSGVLSSAEEHWQRQTSWAATDYLERQTSTDPLLPGPTATTPSSPTLGGSFLSYNHPTVTISVRGGDLDEDVVNQGGEVVDGGEKTNQNVSAEEDVQEEIRLEPAATLAVTHPSIPSLRPQMRGGSSDSNSVLHGTGPPTDFRARTSGGVAAPLAQQIDNNNNGLLAVQQRHAREVVERHHVRLVRFWGFLVMFIMLLVAIHCFQVWTQAITKVGLLRSLAIVVLFWSEERDKPCDAPLKLWLVGQAVICLYYGMGKSGRHRHEGSCLHRFSKRICCFLPTALIAAALRPRIHIIGEDDEATSTYIRHRIRRWLWSKCDLIVDIVTLGWPCLGFYWVTTTAVAAGCPDTAAALFWSSKVWVTAQFFGFTCLRLILIPITFLFMRLQADWMHRQASGGVQHREDMSPPVSLEELEIVPFDPGRFHGGGDDSFAQEEGKAAGGSRGGGAPKECCICMVDFSPEEEIRKTVCDHYFHGSCIGPWLERRKSGCPLCRADLRSGRPPEEQAAPARAVTVMV